MSYSFHTADVFTTASKGGNPLAVIPDARGLSDAQMLAIAREFNYSESVFVFPPESAGNTRRLRIFTPGGELPFAGHPTVGCAFVLASIGEIPLTGATTRIVFEEGVGPISVVIRAKDGKPVSSQLTAARLPEIKDPPPPPEKLAEILSLEPSEIVADDMIEPEAVSCGVPFLFIPLRKPEMLSWVKVDPIKWEESLRGYWAPEMFVFSTDDWSNIFEGGHIRARMFAPGLGIGEDPATGAACTALAGFMALRAETRDGTLRWTVDQGVEMGRPSRLDTEVDVKRGQLAAIRVGGESVLVSSGTLHIDGAA
ncbi:MAG TPA: PhzF family phenazine biosynthesis protein [Gemmatimonadaceae bacterium]|nr:PhzF family phenazine biosynthesis protein [Gemmatimonadaceae bacterium]